MLHRTTLNQINFCLSIIRKMSQQKLSSRIDAALIDLSGTLHVEDEAIGNAVAALDK